MQQTYLEVFLYDYFRKMLEFCQFQLYRKRSYFVGNNTIYNLQIGVFNGGFQRLEVLIVLKKDKIDRLKP